MPKPAITDGKPKANKSKNAKAKRVSALVAAAMVLKKSSAPMRSQELINAMTERGMWSSPKGNTPHATLSAAIQREIATKGKESRFKKVDRGVFASNG